MNLSMKWLNDYVKADMPIKDFVADMTMSGSKVETFEYTKGPVDKVVVGKVVAIKKHEDSEKLWKRLRKCTDATEFRAITDEIFHTLPLK